MAHKIDLLLPLWQWAVGTQEEHSRSVLRHVAWKECNHMSNKAGQKEGWAFIATGVIKSA